MSQSSAQSKQYIRMAQTPVPKLILTLSIPSVITMLVNNVYNLVDTAFVGRLGTSASGAVGIVFGFMAIIQAFGFMFGQGSGSILSRSLGKGDKDTASVFASTGVLFSTIFGLLITIFGFLFLDDIVYALGSTDTIFPYAKTYIFFILIAAPFMSSSLTMNNLLRYEGKAALGMIGMMSGVVLNMALDPIFMFALGMGIAGAGLSTAISQVVSWIILLLMFLTKKTVSSLSLKLAFKAAPTVVFNIMATGLPSLIRQGLNSVTTVLLNSRCAIYGDAAVAAMSIVSRIFFFAFSIALGIGQGFQPVSAFNYGAKKYARVRESFRFTTLSGQFIITVGCVLLCVFSGQLIGIFRDDPEVIAIGTRALILQAIASLFMPPCVATEMLLQTTGKRLAASIISAIRNGLIFIPVLIILAIFRGLPGIQEAQPLSLVLALPVTIPFAISFFKKLPKNDEEDPLPSEETKD